MEQIQGITGVKHIFEGNEQKGIAKISKYSFDEKEDILYNLRAIRDGGRIFKMYTGEYVRLSINGQLVMSDTGMERISNKPFIERANGKVLIAGLGIGLILNAIQGKDRIQEITVIEKYQDVIDIVAPKFKNVQVICADIFDWQPPKNEKYDTIYFDIWPTISRNNLPGIKILHNKFKSRLNRKNPDAYMNSWMKEYLQHMER